MLSRFARMGRVRCLPSFATLKPQCRRQFAIEAELQTSGMLVFEREALPAVCTNTVAPFLSLCVLAMALRVLQV